MRIGIRVDFDRLDELDERFERVDFPVELALPHRMERFELLLGHLDAVAAFVQSRKVDVLSIHAPHGRISKPDALRWLLPVCRLAEDIGVKTVTVHPEKCRNAKEKENNKEAFLRNFALAAETFSGRLSVETFAGKARVLTPGELVEAGLPMTLDVSHVSSQEKTRELIRTNLPNITTVHLSSWSENERHLPLDESCASVALLLGELGFGGVVVLEYLPWHCYRARDDRARLLRIVESGETEPFPPPDEKHRDDKSRWHF